MKSKIQDNADIIQAELERRILHGLACEWEASLWVLPPLQRRAMQKPLFRLKEMKTLLGYWAGRRREICLNRDFVLNHPWDSVREVLRHEIAHQFAYQVLGVRNETPHGASFKKACELLRANPRASGSYETLHERIINGAQKSEEDKILHRVKKLMALAQSTNQHEAETAMIKARELIAKYNIDLIEREGRRDFVSVFVGKPALRHFREEYMLGGLIEDFYFVQGIWTPAYVMEKGRMGRVMEISGTAHNVKIASYVYDFVSHFIDTRWAVYNKNKNLNRYRKTDFAIGILDGFRSKLKTQEKIDVAYYGNKALVSIEDPLLTRYMNYHYPNISSIRRNALNTDHQVLHDGISIGKKLVISEGITVREDEIKYLGE
jgi:hypothetical protein